MPTTSPSAPRHLTSDEPPKRAWLGPLLLLVVIAGGGMGLGRLLAPGGGAGNGEAAALIAGAQSEAIKGTPDSLRRARDLFGEAAALDPDSAEAHANVALSNLLLDGNAAIPADAFARAEASARRALEIDPDRSDAHLALAYVDFYQKREWQAGLAGFERAVQLDPASARAHHWFGAALYRMGDARPALAELDIANRLDPQQRAIVADRALALFANGRVDEALASLRRLARDEPEFAPAREALARIHLARGEDEAWLDNAERAAILRRDAALAEAFAAGRAALPQGGRPAALAATLAVQERGGSAYALARTLALLGRTDDAFAALTRARDAREPGVLELRVDPAFAALRSDPRFQQLAAGLAADLAFRPHPR